MMLSVRLLRVAWCLLMVGTCMGLEPAQASAPVDLPESRGRVVYLDFWASWCVPCRRSFPWMESMRRAYESRGLTIIAVNLDRDRADAERFLSQFPASFPLRFDPDGSLAEKYKVAGMPTSVVIDRRGVVRFTHIGFKPGDGDAYERQLQQLLDEK